MAKDSYLYYYKSISNAFEEKKKCHTQNVYSVAQSCLNLYNARDYSGLNPCLLCLLH